MPVESCLNGVISSLETRVLSSDEAETVAGSLRRDLRDRCKAVNQRDREAWTEINSIEAWERFSTPRIEALRKSLGIFPPESEDLNVQVTGTINGDGYDIQNLLYESRSGVYVTANLYISSPPRRKMPAIIIVHSHHNPRTQGELQDMGMTWARAGCIVLVMDQLSYGERGEHRPGPRLVF